MPHFLYHYWDGNENQQIIKLQIIRHYLFQLYLRHQNRFRKILKSVADKKIICMWQHTNDIFQKQVKLYSS